jgi:monoterpene epsilon-lactone hydrolase
MMSLRSRVWRVILRRMFTGGKHLTIAEHRARSVKNARLMNRVPAGVVVEKLGIDGLQAEWIGPPGAIPGRVVLYLHGGGYITGGIDSHQMMCCLLAQTLKIKVLLPEYRLAPEHPFPAAIDDAHKMYGWLQEQGYKAADIIVAGDSAGGGLSLALVHVLRDAGEPLPGAVVCFSPWADLAHKSQTHITRAKAEVLLRTDVLREWAVCYAGVEKLEHPLISPVYSDFHGFPPILIQVGSDEVLLDDARLLAERARADGVEVRLEIWDGMWHVWQALGDMIPESRQAFEQVGQFIKLNDETVTI